MHLWFWDSTFPVGKPFALPVLRNAQPVNVTVVATSPPLDTGALTFDVLKLIYAIVVMGLACAASSNISWLGSGARSTA
jgi:hypothetical protein